MPTSVRRYPEGWHVPENDRPFTALDAYFRSSVETNPEYDDRCLAMIRLCLVRAMTNDKVPVFVDMGPGNGMVDHQCADVVPKSCGAALLTLVDQRKVSHVVDWIVSSIRSESPWLSRTDRDGRPLKLLKVGSLDRAVAEADKAMRRFAARNRKIALVEGDETLHAELGDGWRLVRLLTPAALDRESGHMQHCIGQGSYDERVVEGVAAYLSLRDPHGNPHATLEIRGRDLIQFQGKQNEHPIEPYIAVVRPWLMENIDLDPLMGNSHVWWSRRIVDSEGRLHATGELPDSLAVHRTLQLQAGPERPLPSAELVVLGHGWLGVKGEGRYTMPKRTSASGITVSAGLATFPPESVLQATSVVFDGCSVDGFKSVKTELGNLGLKKGVLDGIPDGLDLEFLELVDSGSTPLPSRGRIANLQLVRSGSVSIADGLEVKSLDAKGTTVHLPPRFSCEELRVNDSRIEGLTSETVVKRQLTIEGDAPSIVLPDGIQVGKLVVKNWPGGRIPEGMAVDSMDLTGYEAELPENLSIIGNLTVNGRHVHHLPDGLDVGCDLFFIVDDGLPTIGPGTRIGGRFLVVWNDGERERVDRMDKQELTIVEAPAMTI
jgi:hypothetical protein